MPDIRITVNKRTLYIIAFSLSLLCQGTYGWAESNPPRPGQKQDAAAMSNRLEATKAEAKALDSKVKDTKAALTETRNKSVDLAKSIRKNESALQKLEKRMSTLSAEQAEIQTSLTHDQKSMAQLVLALQRLRRVPPEALFARPGAPLEAAQSALLLGEIIPTLDNKADALRQKLERLRDVSQKLQEDKADLLATSDKLKTEEKTMAGLLKERETIYARTSEDLKTKQLEVQQISAKAQNLRDLVGRLQKDRERKQNEARVQTAKSGP
ncbi:MAG: hypothetical protein LRY54_00385 [Alphaproteobacteria bacterium]|nr:hypothetical protein [Alphaproteobacteria bacterium]